MAKRQDTRSFGDSAASAFPKMGDSYLTDHLINVSGNRSPYTMPTQKKGPKQDNDPNVGTAAKRKGYEIKEANGPACTPVARICYPNAPEHNQTQRAMRTVPSKAGLGDFHLARGRDNAGETI